MHKVVGAGTEAVGVRMAVGWALLTGCDGVGCLPPGCQSLAELERRVLVPLSITV